MSTPGHNTFQQFLRQSNPSKAPHGPFVRPSNPRGALTPQASTKTGKPLPSAEPATMRDQTYLLDDSFVLHRPAMKPSAQPATVQGTAIPAGATPLIFRGSDGRLEIDLPRGSLDFAHATLAGGRAPVGQLFLQIHQIAGHYIEAESILGTYQLHLVDSLGQVIQGVVLTQPNPPPEEDPSLPGIGFFCPCAPDIQHVTLDQLGRGEDKPGYSPANDNSGLRFALNSAYGFNPANREVGHPPIPVVAFIRWDVSKDMFPPPPPDECSFTSSTKVATAQGEKAIGDLKVGDKVLAYNPKTHKMELEPILHVWKHTDSDLIDLTLTIETPAHDGKPASTESETIHTTSEHPFLTQDQGFTAAGTLKVGMRLMRADGRVGIVTGWKALKATRVMYNLEVAQDHTFVVGDGQWVVHNRCNPTQLGMRIVVNGGGPWNNGQNPHHIIPCALMNHPLLQLAGFDINDVSNGRFLWDYRHRAQALGAKEPYHANAPGYLRLVRALLDDEYQRLTGPGMSAPTAADAANAISTVIAQLNGAINFQGALGLLGGAACPLPGL